jgi:hypothetical protein
MTQSGVPIMASETEAKPDAKLEAKPEAKSELPELPLVSPIEIPAAAAAAPMADMSAAGAPAIDAAKAELPKAELPKAEPPKPDLIEQKLRLAIEMAAGRSPAEIGKKLAGNAAPAAAAARRPWFTPLAAAIVIAATGGAAFGSLSAAALAYLWSGSGSGVPNRVEANTLQTMKAELAELAALKSSLDGATRGANGQFAKIADRLDRVEHAQAEPAAKLTHIADAVDRLEKKNVVAAASAPETTGSIGAPASIEGTKGDKLLQDWIVQDVRRGHALVASRFGGVFDVMAGSMLPGLGHVQAIKRQDGQWVVLTDKGLITER